MRSGSFYLIIIGFVLLKSATPLFASDLILSQEKPLIQEAKVLIKTYAGQLKSALVHSIKKDGPIAAIDVCARKSPEIAFTLSEDSPWTISRTSLKARNSGSEPDEWERTVLEKFQKRHADGEGITVLEEYSYTEKGNVFRYMKAIPTGNVCLTCHGTNVSPALKAQIDKYYPDDAAIGFKAGDIRGAFTLQKELTP